MSTETHWAGLVRINIKNRYSAGTNTLTLTTAEKNALVEALDHEVDAKPWEDANNEEIWALTIGPNENVYQFNSANRYFDQVGSGYTKGVPAVSVGITAGRRIWPESD